jgi:CBS domain-containing protein
VCAVCAEQEVIKAKHLGRDIVSVRESDTIFEAIRRMDEHKIGKRSSPAGRAVLQNTLNPLTHCAALSFDWLCARAGGLLVFDDKGEKIVGICTERDYLSKVALKDRKSRETRVSVIMSRDVVYGVGSMPVTTALGMLTNRRYDDCSHAS